MAILKTDLDLTTKDLAGLTSPDALTAFLSRLGYETSRRIVLTPSALGLSGDTAASIRSIELLPEDADGFLSLEDARRLVAEFVTYYNTVRLHSAIGYVTPADKLAGRAEAIWAARKEKLATAGARRRAKAEEKEIARPQSSEVH